MDGTNLYYWGGVVKNNIVFNNRQPNDISNDRLREESFELLGSCCPKRVSGEYTCMILEGKRGGKLPIVHKKARPGLPDGLGFIGRLNRSSAFPGH